MEKSDLKRKAKDLSDLPAAVFSRPARPTYRARGLWFALGAGVAALLGFFLDSRRGTARRHMAVERSMAAGRDAKAWSGKKIRHWRNKATGTAAGIQHADGSKVPEKTGSASR